MRRLTAVDHNVQNPSHLPRNLCNQPPYSRLVRQIADDDVGLASLAVGSTFPPDRISGRDIGLIPLDEDEICSCSRKGEGESSPDSSRCSGDPERAVSSSLGTRGSTVPVVRLGQMGLHDRHEVTSADPMASTMHQAGFVASSGLTEQSCREDRIARPGRSWLLILEVLSTVQKQVQHSSN